MDDQVGRIMETFSIHFVPSVDKDNLVYNENECKSDVLPDLSDEFKDSKKIENYNLKEWMNQRNFILSVHLQGHTNNVFIPHLLANITNR